MPAVSLDQDETSFVGREDEIAQLTGMLSDARLVTVTGTGGVGKTRLARRAAARVAAGFPDGAWFVPLSALRDPELLSHTIAAVLGLAGQDARSQAETLLAYLRERRLLLILDTCEHLIDACALFAESVLAEAPDVTVLATSRASLDVAGEHSFPLSPLPVLDSGTPPAGNDALTLFAQRAAAAVPGFAVTSANRPDIARLCRRLDGVPLGIELAAIQLPAMPLPELVARIDGLSAAPSGPRPGAPDRHQSLRGTIGWSYELCTPAERALWRRLSVFAGTFDAGTAAEVCSGRDLPGSEVMAAVVGLVNKSVLTRTDQDPTSRYRLLDTIREFGTAQLAASGQADGVLDRFVKHYLGLARDFGEHFLDSDQLTRYRALAAEHDNIRAALDYALGSPAGRRRETEEAGADMAVALHGYWQISGRLKEGRYWLSLVTSRFPERSRQHAAALTVRGWFAASQGDIMPGVSDLEAGIRIAEELGEEPVAARGYVYQVLALALAGKHPEAALSGAEAQRRATRLGDRVGLHILDVNMSHLHQLSGDFQHTLDRRDQGLRRYEATPAGDEPDRGGERWLHSYLHTVASFALFQQPGREAECAEAVCRGLAAKYELDDVIGIAYSLDVLGWLAARTGDAERVALMFGTADRLWRQAGERLSATSALEEIHQQAAATARAAIGDEAYERAYAESACRPLGEIVALAIRDAIPDP